jgi:hypothetical protein
MMNRLTSLSLLITIVFFLTTGCSNETPEDQVRQYIKNAEKLVEENEIGKIKELIADNYNDEQGKSKKDIIAYLTYQLLTQRSIHLFTSIDTIDIPTEAQAHATVFVAMTGQPIDNASSLLQIRADIYRFNFTLQKIDNKWMLVSSTWQPALLDDLVAAPL